MKGIYKIENLINHKVYIGQSKNLEERMKRHMYNVKNSKKNNQIYLAIRIYGIDNFSFNILESNEDFTQDELNQLEIKYIEKYDSYKHGYNMTPGGSYIPESVNRRVLSEKEVKRITNMLENTNILIQDIAELFDVSPSLITSINRGRSWHSDKISYPIRKNNISFAGGRNGNAKLTDLEVMEIRQDFVYYSLPELQQIYKGWCSPSELKKIVYGSQFKHLPIYKKREKRWYLNGTCTDYPELDREY